MAGMSRSLAAHHRRYLAVLASVEPRTVERYLAAGNVRGASRDAIERGLRKMGRGDLVRPASPAEGRGS